MRTMGYSCEEVYMMVVEGGGTSLNGHSGGRSLTVANCRGAEQWKASMRLWEELSTAIPKSRIETRNTSFLYALAAVAAFREERSLSRPVSSAARRDGGPQLHQRSTGAIPMTISSCPFSSTPLFAPGLKDSGPKISLRRFRPYLSSRLCSKTSNPQNQTTD